MSMTASLAVIVLVSMWAEQCSCCALCNTVYYGAFEVNVAAMQTEREREGGGEGSGRMGV